MSHEIRTPLHAILSYASMLTTDRRTLGDREVEVCRHEMHLYHFSLLSTRTCC